jgi:hypothetical protein
MRIFALIALALCVFPASADEAIPRNLVGVWATEDSVFEGSTLYGGTALYLDTTGDGMLVGAPLPVQKCDGQFCAPRVGARVCASIEKDGTTIRAMLTDGQRMHKIAIVYSAESKSMTIRPDKNSESRLLRRDAEVPNNLRSELLSTKSLCQESKSQRG